MKKKECIYPENLAPRMPLLFTCGRLWAGRFKIAMSERREKKRDIDWEMGMSLGRQAER